MSNLSGPMGQMSGPGPLHRPDEEHRYDPVDQISPLPTTNPSHARSSTCSACSAQSGTEVYVAPTPALYLWPPCAVQVLNHLQGGAGYGMQGTHGAPIPCLSYQIQCPLWLIWDCAIHSAHSKTHTTHGIHPKSAREEAAFSSYPRAGTTCGAFPNQPEQVLDPACRRGRGPRLVPCCGPAPVTGCWGSVSWIQSTGNIFDTFDLGTIKLSYPVK